MRSSTWTTWQALLATGSQWLSGATHTSPCAHLKARWQVPLALQLPCMQPTSGQLHGWELAPPPLDDEDDDEDTEDDEDDEDDEDTEALVPPLEDEEDAAAPPVEEEADVLEEMAPLDELVTSLVGARLAAPEEPVDGFAIPGAHTPLAHTWSTGQSRLDSQVGWHTPARHTSQLSHCAWPQVSGPAGEPQAKRASGAIHATNRTAALSWYMARSAADATRALQLSGSTPA